MFVDRYVAILPLADGMDEAAATTGPDVPANFAAGVRVLIAEDHPLNQKLIRRLLRDSGCTITIVDDGAECVSEAINGGYDVIMMDLSMPHMDGLEATRRIRAHETQTGATRVQIVALTAAVSAGDRKLCTDAGMDDFVQKPFNRSAIEQLLSRVAKRHGS